MSTGAARSAKLAGLVDPDANVELLGGGFKFTEGPIWHPTLKCLLFSDIAGDARHRWTEDRGFTLARRPNGMGNGMTLDRDLSLLVCEHATSSVVHESPDGTRTTIASHYHKKELNSPNDIVARGDGSVYFTDPIYGRRPFNGIERAPQLDLRGIYRVPPGGDEAQLLADDFGQPNGLCFSVDESLLYIDDTPRAHIRVFRVRPDGFLDPGGLFATGIGDGTLQSGGVVDGIKCDEEGNVWVTGPRGIWVFSPAGEHLGIIEIPEIAANLHWGGLDWHSLFITATTSLYRIRTHVTNHAEPFMN